jgi:hypothetical protein
MFPCKAHPVTKTDHLVWIVRLLPPETAALRPGVHPFSGAADVPMQSHPVTKTGRLVWIVRLLPPETAALRTLVKELPALRWKRMSSLVEIGRVECNVALTRSCGIALNRHPEVPPSRPTAGARQRVGF